MNKYVILSRVKIIYVKKKGRKQSLIPRMDSANPQGEHCSLFRIIGCFEAFSSTLNMVSFIIDD